MEQKLWRSPLGKPWFLITTLIILLLTILKLNSSLTFFPRELLVDGKPPIKYDLFDILLYGGWLIGPPLFFLIEYVFIFGKDESRRLDDKQVADLKYCHELAGKIWAGVSVFLGILLLTKHNIKL